MKSIILTLFMCLVLSVLLQEIDGYKVPDRGSDDYPDYQLGVRYDEYPLIVPKKRTALLVNRLMVALKKAMEQDEKEDQLKRANSLNMFSRSNKDYSLLSKDLRQMDLQRRGHGDVTQQKGRIYWRCYFNAVTCF